MRLFCIFITLLVSLNLFAQEPVSTINARSTPAQISILGETRSATATIAKLKDNSFGICVTVSYRSLGGDIRRHVFTFPVEDASFVQREKDLFLVHDGQEVLLAHHEWWYSPSWIISNKNIKVKANLKKIDSKRSTLDPQILIFE